MLTEDLDYDLPEEQIATVPAQPRDAARLMVVHRASGRIEHRLVRDLPRLGVVGPGDLMVVNRTRVLPASFEAVRAATGGRVRGLYLRSQKKGDWQVLLESRGKLRVGERLDVTVPDGPEASQAQAQAHLQSGSGGATLTLIRSLGRGRWRARCNRAGRAEAVLERMGRTPLPPYIRQTRRRRGQAEAGEADRARYNTVYAREAGSAAAPTAGLHFTPGLLTELEDRGVMRAEVVLNVGLGTFEPIRVADLADHHMHRERLNVPGPTIEAIRRTRAAAGRILAVGTTTVRALESLPGNLAHVSQGHAAETDLFIHPDAGITFRFTDMLLTNFHLPRSTLLAMLAALPGVGVERLMRWYRIAIDEHYRFYSYGDAMLLA